jgi:mannose-6-phosphate isomerase-like protein (cupin superfamily)
MEVQRLQGNESFITKDGSEIRSIMDFSNSGIKNLTLAQATVKANQSTLWHVHQKSEEIYYILEGRGKMMMGSETEAVETGCAVRIPAGLKHCISNTGDCDLVFLCCCAPGYTHEQTQLFDVKD